MIAFTYNDYLQQCTGTPIAMARNAHLQVIIAVLSSEETRRLKQNVQASAPVTQTV